MCKKVKKKNSVITIRLESDLKKKYLDFCDKNCYDLSKRIRFYIESDINEHVNQKTNL